MLIAISLETLVVAEEDIDGEETYSPNQHTTVTDIEYKDKTTQSNLDVELQLEANMMLLTSQVLAIKSGTS